MTLSPIRKNRQEILQKGENRKEAAGASNRLNEEAENLRKEIIQKLENPETIGIIDELIRHKKHPDEIHSLLETKNIQSKRILTDLSREKHKTALKIDLHERDFVMLEIKIDDLKRKLMREREKADEEGDRKRLISVTQRLIVLKDAIKKNNYLVLDRITRES